MITQILDLGSHCNSYEPLDLWVQVLDPDGNLFSSIFYWTHRELQQKEIWRWLFHSHKTLCSKRYIYIHMYICIPCEIMKNKAILKSSNFLIPIILPRNFPKQLINGSKFTQPTHQSQVTKVAKPPVVYTMTPGECCSNYRIDLKDAAAESQSACFLVKFSPKRPVCRPSKRPGGFVKVKVVVFTWKKWKGWWFFVFFWWFSRYFFIDFCSSFDEQITSKLGKKNLYIYIYIYVMI